MSDIYSTLNPQQQEAVYHTEGPLLILAGAGSGKTRVLSFLFSFCLQIMVLQGQEAHPRGLLQL